MRLSCPNCDAQYEVPADAIPEGGRDVQCSNCGHTWFQRHLREETAAQPAPAPAEEPAATAEPAAQADEPAEAGAEAPQEALAEPEPTAGAEPGPVEEPAPEVTAAPEPEPAVEPEPEPEPEPEVEPEVEPVGAAAEPEPQPVEIFPEEGSEDIGAFEDPEPAREPAPEPEPEPEPEVEATAEPAPEPEPEPEAEPAAEPAPAMAADAAPAADEKPAIDPDAAAIAALIAASTAAGGRSPDDDPDTEADEPPDVLGARPAMDEGVRSILREEADRESAARRRESQQLQSQPDLGVEAPPLSVAQRRLAMLKGEDPDSPIPPEAKPAARRDLLPDVEEINSTLQPADDGFDPDAAVEALPDLTKGSFRSGFVLMVFLALVAAVVYVMAPRLSAAIPGLDGTLTAYVGFVDGLRGSLDRLMESAANMLAGGN